MSAAKRDLKSEDLSVSKGNIFVPGLALLEFILILCWPKVLRCCRCPCDNATTCWYDNDEKTRHDTKTQQGVKMRWYNNTTTLLSMPKCIYIIVRFTNLFELWAGAQTIWNGRRMLWFRQESSASKPARMKIMRMNFLFAGFLWCHAYAILMPLNWFQYLYVIWCFLIGIIMATNWVLKGQGLCRQRGTRNLTKKWLFWWHNLKAADDAIHLSAGVVFSRLRGCVHSKNFRNPSFQRNLTS